MIAFNAFQRPEVQREHAIHAQHPARLPLV